MRTWDEAVTVRRVSASVGPVSGFSRPSTRSLRLSDQSLVLVREAGHYETMSLLPLVARPADRQGPRPLSRRHALRSPGPRGLPRRVPAAQGAVRGVGDGAARAAALSRRTHRRPRRRPRSARAGHAASSTTRLLARSSWTRRCPPRARACTTRSCEPGRGSRAASRSSPARWTMWRFSPRTSWCRATRAAG